MKMNRLTIQEKRTGHANAGKIFFPLASESGKASTSIAGLVVFLLGIGLTLFVIVNPMNVAIFERISHAIMHGEYGSEMSAAGGQRNVMYYQCPMHPTYISDEPGTCGICGMDLVPKYEDAEGTAKGSERKIKYWRAPMDPTYISDTPGKSPMGMDLVPVYEDEVDEASPNAIRIDPATVQNIGVVTEPVERGDLKVDIRTVGNLDYDEGKVFLVNTKYDGWIEKVYVNYIGERVERGEPLFEIYSPDLVSTQEEYLSALEYRNSMQGSGFPEAEARADDLLEAARSRLLYWDITEEQIQRLEENHAVKRTLTVVSPASGIVAQKMDQALEGMRAMAGMNLYKIVDLSTLWVHVDLYEYQLPWIQVGQKAEIEIGAFPGEIFRGKVLFFYPQLDKKTRTIRACVEIPNPDGKLRAQMFATVRFSPVAEQNVVLVPEMAVLHSGERDVVVLALGEGRFEPREVKLGLQGGGNYEVLEGLEGGEKIVTSSQFLIDSESNLREAINKMLMARKGEAASERMDESMTEEVEQGSGTDSVKMGSDMKGLEHTQQEMAAVDEPEDIAVFQKVLDAYLPIWKTLANDSTRGIDENAKELEGAAKKAAQQIEAELTKKRLEALEKAASEMRTDDLAAARESMKVLSRALLSVFEAHTIALPKKYPIMECTMAGEKWIQDSDDVLNPFFGSMMLRCGAKVGEIG